jgi:hypothetical protein
MEIILNIAWVICSLGLIWLWARNTASNPVQPKTQILALAMVVLLLLPVISVSDDLMAMQSPAETDTYLRKAVHPDDIHPLVTPTSFALPEESVTELSMIGYTQDAMHDYRLAPPSTFLILSLDIRPPPQA